MHVTVSFLGPLRDQVGQKSLVLDLPEGATYRTLLDQIGPTMEARLAEWAWDRGKRAFSPRMMVSRNLSADLRDPDTPLANGDEILVLLPLAGG